MIFTFFCAELSSWQVTGSHFKWQFIKMLILLSLRLSTLEKLNLKINRAYLFKENFQYMREYKYPERVKKFLKQWFRRAAHFRLKHLRSYGFRTVETCKLALYHYMGKLSTEDELQEVPDGKNKESRCI